MNLAGPGSGIWPRHKRVRGGARACGCRMLCSVGWGQFSTPDGHGPFRGHFQGIPS